MSTITIEIPESVLLATSQSREAFTSEARFLLAAKLFELERLSSGKAAQLCGMTHPDFLLAVSQRNIPVVRLAGEELDMEFRDE